MCKSFLNVMLDFGTGWVMPNATKTITGHEVLIMFVLKLSTLSCFTKKTCTVAYSDISSVSLHKQFTSMPCTIARVGVDSKFMI